jgi:ribosome-binding factor A
MKRRLPRRTWRETCAEPGPGDGVDPKDERRAAERAGSARLPRKSLQLARQVAHTVDGALAASPDPVLRDLQVLSAAPAPDASRYLVTVSSLKALTPDQAQDALGRLAAGAARLRAEVASAICRRKVPLLAFQLAPARVES